MRSYDLAIFDFDGTLADSFPWFCSVLNDAARRFHFREVRPEELEKFRGLGNHAIMTELGIPLWRVPSLAAHMRALSETHAASIPLHRGAADALAALRAAGLRVAVVSSNGEGTIRKVLGAASAHVERIDGGASLWGKARKLRAAVRAFGVPTARTIALGDEVRDVEAAREAGVAAGVVSFGFNHEDALRAAGAAAVFHSFDEIVAALTSR